MNVKLSHPCIINIPTRMRASIYVSHAVYPLVYVCRRGLCFFIRRRSILSPLGHCLQCTFLEFSRTKTIRNFWFYFLTRQRAHNVNVINRRSRHPWGFFSDNFSVQNIALLSLNKLLYNYLNRKTTVECADKDDVKPAWPRHNLV